MSEPAQDGLSMWRVSKSRQPRPGWRFIARRWRISNGAYAPTQEEIGAETLWQLKADLEAMGLTSLDIGPSDMPGILESYV